jgi:hypothetical protein
MANLSLTARCTPCSLLESPNANRPALPALTPASFLDALDRLQRAGLRELRLLCGEPALHPDFAWMLTRAAERGFRLLVATYGRMPYAILRKLERLPPDSAMLLVRVAVPGESSPAERARQVNLYHRLGPRVVPCLEVLSPSAPFALLLELIAAHGLARRARLELVADSPEVGDCLRPTDRAEIDGRIRAFAREAWAAGVEVELGCGFVPCMAIGACGASVD